jgi:hypothetical protein
MSDSTNVRLHRFLIIAAGQRTEPNRIPNLVLQDRILPWGTLVRLSTGACHPPGRYSALTVSTTTVDAVCQ